MARGSFGNYRIYPDENLGRIVGNRPVKPSQMTKKIWSYIKIKKLGKSGFYKKVRR